MKLLCEVHYEYIMGNEICMLSFLLAVQWALHTIVSALFKAGIYRWLIIASLRASWAAEVNVPNILDSATQRRIFIQDLSQ